MHYVILTSHTYAKLIEIQKIYLQKIHALHELGSHMECNDTLHVNVNVFCFTVSNNKCYLKLFNSNAVKNEFDHYTEGIFSQMKSFNLSLKMFLMVVFLICLGRKFHNFGPI